MRRAGAGWPAAALLLAALAPAAAGPPSRGGTATPSLARACAANPLCRCRTDQLVCDYVPFYRFPETAVGVRHVGMWAARLGALGEAALDGRPLRTLGLVAARLHRLDRAALLSMSTSLASLDLGYNEFTEVPVEALRYLKVLNWLNLQNNYIGDLDRELDWGALSDSLGTLSLSNNYICFVRYGALSSLRQLAQLELDGNRLQQMDARALPPAVALLRLSNNLLPHIPCRVLSSLPRLRHLHLRNNILRPSSNFSCRSNGSKIDSLDLSHNELADHFRLEFFPPLELKQLVLDLNEFTALPSFILDCGKLEKLSVSYNKMQHVSHSILYALKHSLERLELDHNELATLPESIRELYRLRHLSVSYNRLEDVTHLPTKLHSLSLAGNLFIRFPTALRDAPPATLSYLDLGYNRISHVGADVFGDWSTGLTTLSLKANRIAQLALGSFPALPLRELVLSFNDLYFVEKGVFAELSNLRILELSTALFSSEMPTGSTLHSLSWLGLDNNNIHFISSEDIQRFPSLEYLNLDFNKIVEFPSKVTKSNASYKLKELRLAYNYINKINSDFLEGLSHLQSVDVSYNRMHNVSSRGFCDLPNLVYLSLVGNVLEVIAESAFVNLPKLEELEIQQNNLIEFSLRQFENVSKDQVSFSVNVSYNYISSLVGGRRVPINILDLSHNSLSSVFRDFFDSFGEHISQLFLSHNKIVQLDALAFGSLPNLNVLNLHSNSIVTVRRRAFAELPSLQILELSHNHISQLAVEQFDCLRRLRHLRLESNKLRALPRDAFKNTMIEYLDVSDNQLSLFPSSALAQVGFTLRRLELSRNRIQYLDAAMFRTTAFLHELGIAHNYLTVLSDNTFAGLPRLYRLDISNNAIKTNFKELFHNAPGLRRLSLTNIGLNTVPHLPLENLTELNLSDNYIKSYDENDARRLTNLRALDISGNKLTSLRPAMWSALPGLISLDVSRNPIVRIPQGSFDGLHHLLHLKMTHLNNLETLEPRAFRSLPSIKALSIELVTGAGRRVPISDIVFATPFIEALEIFPGENMLDSQLLGLRAFKLKSLEVRGSALRQIAGDAFAALGQQRALTVRVVHTSVEQLPPGLVSPLARVPLLALDFSHNRLTGLQASTLYPNLTGWNRLATKLVPGGLELAGNPLRCGCAAAWAGAWLRRWSSEVGGGARGARAAAARATCVLPGGTPDGLHGLPLGRLPEGSFGPAPRPLLALLADTDCHASALSSRSPPRHAHTHFTVLSFTFIYSCR